MNVNEPYECKRTANANANANAQMNVNEPKRMRMRMRMTNECECECADECKRPRMNEPLMNENVNKSLTNE